MIREAVATDIPAVVRIMEDANECYPGYSYSTLAGGILLVAEDHDTIVGYARFDLGRPETYIRSFAVAPGVRRALWGRRLIGAVWQRARAFGSQGLQGVASSKAAARLYESHSCCRLQPTVRVRIPYTEYVRYLDEQTACGGPAPIEVLALKEGSACG